MPTDVQTMTIDQAVEAIRAASFEAPVAHSHTEWATRIKAVLTAYAAQVEPLQRAVEDNHHRRWRERFDRSHDHSTCEDFDDCRAKFEAWLAEQP
jgi:hypothetical protein